VDAAACSHSLVSDSSWAPDAFRYSADESFVAHLASSLPLLKPPAVTKKHSRHLKKSEVHDF
jgi:hypothetical protein